MKTRMSNQEKLTLSKETVRSLTVRTALRAGNDGPSVLCSGTARMPSAAAGARALS